jgi:NDP-sugar pyrophosphorylase family protein
MAPSANLKKWAVLGENVCLEKDVEITRSILWDNVRIKKGIKIKDSIVTCSRVVDHDLIKEIY